MEDDVSDYDDFQYLCAIKKKKKEEKWDNHFQDININVW